MLFKKLFFSFVFLILLFGVLPTPVSAGSDFKAREGDSSEKISVPEIAVTKDIVSHADSKQIESFIMGSGFSYSGINVSGYVTRPNGNPVTNATVVLGTPKFNGTPPANWCTLNPGNDTNTTTDSNGYFILGSSLQVTSGNSTCDLNIVISHDNYVTDHSNTTIEYNGTDHTEYPNTNRTLLLHANLTAAITTDLMNDPYSNYGQDYHAIVNITNLGDVTANSVAANMTAANG